MNKSHSIPYSSTDPRDPLGLRGSQWLRLTTKERNRCVKSVFQFWREEGFPHYRLSTNQVRLEFLRLLNTDGQRLFSGREIRSANTGLRLANAYQPRMWSTRVSR